MLTILLVLTIVTRVNHYYCSTWFFELLPLLTSSIIIIATSCCRKVNPLSCFPTRLRAYNFGTKWSDSSGLCPLQSDPLPGHLVSNTTRQDQTQAVLQLRGSNTATVKDGSGIVATVLLASAYCWLNHHCRLVVMNQYGCCLKVIQ